MTQLLIPFATLLHALSTVVFVGYFVLMAVLILPASTQNGFTPQVGAWLSSISHRSRSWLYSALVLLGVTGTYLTLVDANYRGIGNFANPWAILMLIKHIVILGMLVLGFWFNSIRRVGPLMAANTRADQALAAFRWYTNAMAFAGVLVLLLPAVSEAQ
jgi:uncharacterized membrane protein